MSSSSNEERIQAHRDWLAKLPQEGGALFVELYTLLSEIDELLVKSDEVLNYSQPPMDGKLGIRFWRRQRSDRLEPIVVAWKKNQQGRFWPEQVHGHLTKRVCLRGAFALNASVTAETIAIVDKLLEMRKSVTSSLFRIRQSVASLKMHQTPVLAYQRERLDALRLKGEENLESLYSQEMGDEP